MQNAPFCSISDMILNWLLKNKSQVVRQGARGFDKRSILGICEHWREPRNAAWRPYAQFFNAC
jgi:hypothetical protein